MPELAAVRCVLAVPDRARSVALLRPPAAVGEGSSLPESALSWRKRMGIEPTPRTATGSGQRF